MTDAIAGDPAKPLMQARYYHDVDPIRAALATVLSHSQLIWTLKVVKVGGLISGAGSHPFPSDELIGGLRRCSIAPKGHSLGK